MRFFLLFLALIPLAAKEYMGTVVPIQSYTLYAQTGGEVITADPDMEGQIIQGVLVEIDSRYETNTLQALKEQQRLYNAQLKIRQAAYEKAAAITQKSQTEKDTLKLALLDVQNRLSDLSRQIEELKITLGYKRIPGSGLYLKKLFVNRHDYVTKGAKIATLYDTSKARIVLFVLHDEIQTLRERTLYINGQKSSAKIIKIDTTPDEVYVSSHRVEIALDSKAFGEVVRVEFR